MRFGWHLVTDCRKANQGRESHKDVESIKANQGRESHKDVESILIHYFNTYTHITATKAEPFPNNMQADILLSGITTIDNPTAKNWHIDVPPPTPGRYQPKPQEP